MNNNLEPTEAEVEKLIKKLEEHAKAKGFVLNPNKRIVENIAKALLKKEANVGAQYCPCRVVTGNKEEDKKIICPCIFHEKEVEDDGHCFCRLFYRGNFG